MKLRYTCLIPFTQRTLFIQRKRLLSPEKGDVSFSSRYCSLTNHNPLRKGESIKHTN